MTWIKPLSYNTFQRVFDFGNGFTNRNLVLAFVKKTSGALLYLDGKSKEATDVFPLNIWTHVAVTSTNKDIIFYLNGEQKLVVNGSLERTETKLNYIGKSLYASDSNIDAVLDEFKIFNRSLTEEEIKKEENIVDLVTTTKPKIFTEGLVHYWPMAGSKKDILGNRDIIKLESANYEVDRFGNADSGEKIFFYNSNCKYN